MIENPLLGSQNETTEKVIVRRDQFANGPSGDFAYQALLSGPICKVIDPVTQKECGQLSVRTTDFDVLGTMESIPNCGGTCEALIRRKVESDLAKINAHTVFGKNGWGRQKA